jgi:hypothetical protein
MLSQKVKRSGEFFLTKGNKRKERTKDQVLAHELLASTLSYLMPAPWRYTNPANLSSWTPPMSSLVSSASLLITAVSPEMLFLLSKKRTAKQAWDAITAARIGSDRACKTTLQALRKEWENLSFKPGEDIDDFALRLNTLLQKMV